MKRCVYCGELINDDARKCKACGEWQPRTAIVNSCGFGLGNPAVNVIFWFCLIIVGIVFLVTLDTQEWDFFYLFLGGGVIGYFVLYFYLFPTILAYAKNHPQTFVICLVNLLLGETVLGWLIALIWAANDNY